MKRTVTSIINETASHLTLNNIEGQEMALAPLQEKAVSEDSGFYTTDLERNGIVGTGTEAPRDVSEKLGGWLGVCAGLAFFMFILMKSNSKEWEIPTAAWVYAVWGWLLILIAGVAVVIIRGTNSFSLVARWMKNAAVLTVILGIGLGLPAATI